MWMKLVYLLSVLVSRYVGLQKVGEYGQGDAASPGQKVHVHGPRLQEQGCGVSLGRAGLITVG